MQQEILPKNAFTQDHVRLNWSSLQDTELIIFAVFNETTSVIGLDANRRSFAVPRTEK